MSMFDTEMFINEIEKHECIWKTDAKEYSNRNVKAAAWNGIGETMYDDWKGLSYDEQRIKSKSLYKFYAHSQFFCSVIAK